MSHQPQPCVVIRKALIEETLRSAPVPGKRNLDPLHRVAAEHGMPMNIMEDVRVAGNVELHRQAGDLWHCLEGEVTFVYGGTLVKPEIFSFPDGRTDEREIRAESIAGGSEVLMTAGDWFWIPPGQPHLHRTGGTARLVIIKVPAFSIVPLEAVPGWPVS